MDKDEDVRLMTVNEAVAVRVFLIVAALALTAVLVVGLP